MVEDRNARLAVQARVAAAPEPAVFTLDVESGGDAVAMTAAIDALCAQVEDQRGVALIRMQDGQRAQAWPGAITVQDANRWERALRRLEGLSAIVVAVARGDCGGPALDLLLASDHRIAAPDLRLSFPLNDGQFWPGMGLYRLAHQLGTARARQLVLWGGELDASGCIQLGLVDEISDDMQAAVDRTVQRLSSRAASEFAVRRRLLLEAASAPYEDALGAHLAACDRELRRIRALP
jgi:isomerase DpgB